MSLRFRYVPLSSLFFDSNGSDPFHFVQLHWNWESRKEKGWIIICNRIPADSPLMSTFFKTKKEEMIENFFQWKGSEERVNGREKVRGVIELKVVPSCEWIRWSKSGQKDERKKERESEKEREILGERKYSILHRNYYYSDDQDIEEESFRIMRMYRIVVTKCNELQGKDDDSDLKWYKISRMGEVWFSEEVERERGREKGGKKVSL